MAGLIPLSLKLNVWSYPHSFPTIFFIPFIFLFFKERNFFLQSLSHTTWLLDLLPSEPGSRAGGGGGMTISTSSSSLLCSLSLSGGEAAKLGSQVSMDWFFPADIFGSSEPVEVVDFSTGPLLATAAAAALVTIVSSTIEMPPTAPCSESAGLGALSWPKRMSATSFLTDSGRPVYRERRKKKNSWQKSGKKNIFSK